MKFNYDGNSNKAGIYSITNTKTNKILIGNTYNFKKRWSRHKESLLFHIHQNKELQKEYSLYKSIEKDDSFLVFNIIEIVDLPKEKREELEKEYIEKYKQQGVKLYNKPPKRKNEKKMETKIKWKNNSNQSNSFGDDIEDSFEKTIDSIANMSQDDLQKITEKVTVQLEEFKQDYLKKRNLARINSVERSMKMKEELKLKQTEQARTEIINKLLESLESFFKFFKGKEQISYHVKFQANREAYNKFQQFNISLTEEFLDKLKTNNILKDFNITIEMAGEQEISQQYKTVCPVYFWKWNIPELKRSYCETIKTLNWDIK